MKNYSIALFTLLLILLTITLIASIFISSDALTNQATAGIMLQQITPSPTTLLEPSEIGSTDGILVMGVVIVLIVTLPLLFRKK